MQRFTFSRNWRRFSRNLDDSQVTDATDSVRAIVGDLIESPKLALDLGCGSGLFSIALARLGAAEVIGVDLDADCIRTAQANVERYVPTPRNGNVHLLQGSILDAAFMRRLPAADLVYAWGSLHHTGDLRRAVQLVAERVAPGGVLVAAIYNRCLTAPLWKIIKRMYRCCPSLVQAPAAAGLFLTRASVRAIRGRHPFKDRRGMTVYVDAHDWLGGYPYEYASADEVERIVVPLGFDLLTMNTTRGSGCNEFVFRKRSA